MKRGFSTAVRSSLAVILLTVGMSAQRYTGHDHAVFHRPPQPPAPTAKHTLPQNNAKTTPRNAGGASTGSTQAAPRAAGQVHTDSAQPQLSPAETASESTPHF